MKSIFVLAAAGLAVWPAVRNEIYPAAPVIETALTATAPADDFTWRKAMAEGQVLEIKGVNGDIRAEVADGRQAEVTATKKSRRSDVEDVEIKVVEHSGGVTICAVYPTPRRARRDNECAPGDGGSLNSENNDVTVNFTVKVPRGVKYTAHTVNGEVRAVGLQSDVDAATVNGSVDVRTTGRAMASTVNGSLDVVMGRADFNDDVSFSTVNGDLTIEVPGEIHANLRASTVNGDITSDFPITVRGRFGPRRVTGTLGNGGHELELETVNGSITLKRSR